MSTETQISLTHDINKSRIILKNETKSSLVGTGWAIVTCSSQKRAQESFHTCSPSDFKARRSESRRFSPILRERFHSWSSKENGPTLPIFGLPTSPLKEADKRSLVIVPSTSYRQPPLLTQPLGLVSMKDRQRERDRKSSCGPSQRPEAQQKQPGRSEILLRPYLTAYHSYNASQ